MRSHERDEVGGGGVKGASYTRDACTIYRASGSRIGHDSSPRFQYINISWELISIQVRLDSTRSKVANELPKDKRYNTISRLQTSPM